MAKFLLILTTLAIIESCYSLSCYNCTSGKECLSSSFDSSKASTITCGAITGSKPQCLVRTEKDKTTGVEMTIRKCLLQQNPDADCKTIKPNVEIVNCKVCDTDLCNTASDNTFTVTLFAVPLIYFITRAALH